MRKTCWLHYVHFIETESLAFNSFLPFYVVINETPKLVLGLKNYTSLRDLFLILWLMTPSIPTPVIKLHRGYFGYAASLNKAA